MADLGAVVKLMLTAQLVNFELSLRCRRSVTERCLYLVVTSRTTYTCCFPTGAVSKPAAARKAAFSLRAANLSSRFRSASSN